MKRMDRDNPAGSREDSQCLSAGDGPRAEATRVDAWRAEASRVEASRSTDKVGDARSAASNDSALDSALDSAIEIALGQVFEGSRVPADLPDRILLAWRTIETDGQLATNGQLATDEQFAATNEGVVDPKWLRPVQPAAHVQPAVFVQPAARDAQSTPRRALALAASLALLVVGVTTAGYLFSPHDLDRRDLGSRDLGSRDLGSHWQGGPRQELASSSHQPHGLRSSPVLDKSPLAGQAVPRGVSADGVSADGISGSTVPESTVSRSTVPLGATGNLAASARPGRASMVAGSNVAPTSESFPNAAVSAATGSVRQQSPRPPRDSAVAASPSWKPDPRGPWGEHEVVAWVNSRLAQVWHEANVVPAERASDEDWCRRLFLRVLGRIPTVAEVREFLAESSMDKREQWAQRLTACDSTYAAEFALHWADFWATALVGLETSDVSVRSAKAVDDRLPGSRDQLAAMLVDRFQSRAPFDAVAVELIGAAGNDPVAESAVDSASRATAGRGAARARLSVGRVSQVLLGRNLQCVQCHADAHAETDAESEAAARLYRELWGDDRQARAVRITASGEFSQAVVNRVWSHFLGYGLSSGYRDSSRAVGLDHSELLATLGNRFAEHRFDFAALVRWIVLSDAFSLSSRSGGEDSFDAPENGRQPLFSRYYARPMRVEQLYESLRLLASELSPSQSVGAVATPGAAVAGGGLQSIVRTDQDFAQRRAFFTAVAGRVATGYASEGSMDNALSMDTSHNDSQAIIESVSRSLIAADTELPRRVFGGVEESLVQRVISDAKLGLDEKVGHLFQAAVARLPSTAETQAARDLVGASPMDPAIGLRDLWWALLNSNEFLLDH